MKSSKSFLLCLFAGLFISANCAAVGTDKDLTTTVSTTKIGSNETTATVPPVTSSAADPTPTDTTTLDPDTTTLAPDTTTLAPDTTSLAPNNTTTLAPETTTITTTSTSSTTSPVTTTSTTSTTSSTTQSPNTTTSTTPAPSSTTEIPSTTAAPPAPCPHVNTTSFIGGIVLTLGLLAISLVAYKFYKARNERNYHTL